MRNDQTLRWIKIWPQHPMPEPGEFVLIGHSGEKRVGGARFHREPDGAFWFESADGYARGPAEQQRVELVNQACRHMERLRAALKDGQAVKGMLDALGEDLWRLLVDASKTGVANPAPTHWMSLPYPLEEYVQPQTNGG